MSLMKTPATIRRFAVVGLVLSLASCASKRPLLSPNAHYESVGAETAGRDVDDCMRRAKDSGIGTSAKREAAESVGGGAAVGSASGAVAGAIAGGAGRGAAAGAAGGAVAGLFHLLFRRKASNPTFRLFVEQCLTDRGYQPGGWQ
jgi:hypothetical protein